jgi:hypothetical protein
MKHCSTFFLVLKGLTKQVGETSLGVEKLFSRISRTKFARKLLNLRRPQALKFSEITALVPFSTATPDFTNSPTSTSRAWLLSLV